MRQLDIINKNLILKEEVEVILEREIKPFGTSAKADVPKKYLGRRVYVIVLRD